MIILAMPSGSVACRAEPQVSQSAAPPYQSTATPATPYSLQALHFETRKDGSSSLATIGELEIVLHEPDDPGTPSAWEGPLEVRRRDGQSCNAEPSLITRVYIDSPRETLVILSYSGSRTFVDFVAARTCESRWARIEAVTEQVVVSGNRISIHPACEGEAPRARCHAGVVLESHPDRAPSVLSDESRAFTKAELGVDFTGQAWIENPKTPRARIVK